MVRSPKLDEIDPRPARGLAGERRARVLLERAGLRIEDTRVRAGGVELDIVAWEGETLVFVEVRWRMGAELGHPTQTVGLAKQRRLARGARAYLCRRGLWRAVPTRFDVVGIVGEETTWVRDAFWA